jgi:hypothetical protein
MCQLAPSLNASKIYTPGQLGQSQRLSVFATKLGRSQQAAGQFETQIFFIYE